MGCKGGRGREKGERKGKGEPAVYGKWGASIYRKEGGGEEGEGRGISAGSKGKVEARRSSAFIGGEGKGVIIGRGYNGGEIE